MPGKAIAIQELLNMEANLTGFLIFTGCGALLCILWFFLALRKKTGSGKAALISSLSLALGVLLGVACARTVYVLCMLQYRYPLLDISYDQLSYYGGMAGVGDQSAFKSPVPDGRNEFGTQFFEAGTGFCRDPEVRNYIRLVIN